MINFDILSLFPDMFSAITDFSIIKRAIDNELLSIDSINIRDYSKDKHKKVDDYPYGGGQGLLMQAQPLEDAILSRYKDNSHIVYMSPKGKLLNQNIIKGLSKKDHIIIICGHYEGIDQRIIDKYVDEEISIGDYVLTGGELPAMVLVDCIARMIPGVIKEDSLKNESHYNNLLEHPQYTRPECYKGQKVPEILLSGNHKLIEEYNHEQSLIITYKNRPDLIDYDTLEDYEKEIIDKLK